jgi:hypothetical protein
VDKLRAHSKTVIAALFVTHFAPPVRVFDFTYGDGGFWRWPHPGVTVVHDEQVDFRAARGLADKSFDVVTFDPPHTASGCSAWSHKYGICRKHGGPRNRADVRTWLMAGVNEALRVARRGVIIKYKDCVEGGVQSVFWPDVMWLLAEHGWQAVEVVEIDGQRAQPSGRSYTGVYEPTRYVVAVPKGPRRSKLHRAKLSNTHSGSSHSDILPASPDENAERE